jgi:hypothetical protein
MCATGVEAIRLLGQETRQQRDDQRHAEHVEGVAEGEDEGLLLHDLADRNIGTMHSVNAVDHTVVHASIA